MKNKLLSILHNCQSKKYGISLLLLIFLTANSAFGATYYIDSVAGLDSNNGTAIGTPWKSVSKVNLKTLLAGDKIYLKCGSVWNGEQLKFSGSGSLASPIIVDQYGTGAKPILNGNGLTTADQGVVYLYNQQYIEINNLEITNYPVLLVYTNNTAYTVNQIVYNGNYAYKVTVAGTTATSAPTHTSGTAIRGNVTFSYYCNLINLSYPDNMFFTGISDGTLTNNPLGADRRGVMIALKDKGTGTAAVANHIYLKNLNIHHIKGQLGNGSTAVNGAIPKRTGGIYFTVLNEVAASNSRFNDVLIDGCTISYSENMGLAFDNEDNVYYPGGSELASWTSRKFTNIKVSNNVIHHIGKNAMIIRCTDETGLVEHNTCYETALGTTGNTMFTARAKGTVFQYNEGYYNRGTTQTVDPGTIDGSMYDPDYGSVGIIFQYSYSHDNSEGIYWGCNTRGLNNNTTGIPDPEDVGCTLRYNISQNDKGDLIFLNYSSAGNEIYNNVFYIKSGLSPNIIHENSGNNHTYNFYNNIIYNSGNGGYAFGSGTGVQTRTIQNNTFYGTHPSDEPTDINKLTSDPLFISPGAGTIGINSLLEGYKLQSGSPALSTGKLVSANGGLDFFGNGVSSSIAPNRGAYQGEAFVTETPAPTANSQNFCALPNPSVANLVASGTLLKWYSSEIGGNVLTTNTILGTATYYVSQTIGGIESARTSVLVTVNTTSAPTASAQAFCNSGTVANLVANGTNLQWYDILIGGIVLSNSTILASGTYYVSQTLNGCESARTSVLVTVNTTSAPTESAQALCNSGTVANLVATGTNLQWYATATDGIALATNITLSSDTYYVSQTLNGCESTRTSVAVTIQAYPNAGTNGVLTLCAGTTPSESALFERLGGRPISGGTWSNVGLVYIYTLAGTSPCGNAIATVTVTEQAAPNAGTNGTLSLSSSPSDEVLFAVIGTHDAGSWTRPSSGYLGVYTYTVFATSPCMVNATSTVTVTSSSLLPMPNTTYNSCTGAKVSNLTATFGEGVKAYVAASGGFALSDITLKGTASLPVAYYLSEPTPNGESERVRIEVIINALPASPLTLVLTNDNAVSPTTAVTAVGVYVGTDTPFKLTAAAVGAVSYVWTLPLGVVRTNATGATIDISKTSEEAFIYVKFSAYSSTSPTALVIKVQSVNALGCTSAIKSSTSLTRSLPIAPAAIKMTDAALPVNATTGLPIVVTSFAKYMGTTKELTLTATASGTATSYIWELPEGVTITKGSATVVEGVLSSGLNNEITVNFADVTKKNIYNYNNTTPIVPVSTNVLRIGVKSVNGVGVSKTSNALLANSSPLFYPNNTSTAKLLTLTAVAPAAPNALVLSNGDSATAITVISKFIGQGKTFKLAAAVPATTIATSFAWDLPACVTRVTSLTDSDAITGSDALKSTNPIIYVKFTQDATASPGFIYFGVKAVNGVGSSNSSLANATVPYPFTSSESKLLKLATAAPVSPSTLVLNDLASASPTTAVIVLGKYIGKSTKLKLTAGVSSLASTYSWALPMGVNRVDESGASIESTTSTNSFIYVNFAGITPESLTSISLVFGVTAVNGVGSSTTLNAAPNEIRTDKLLTVTAGLPSVVTTVSNLTILSVCSRSEGYSYTITAPVGANYYQITGPAGSIVTSESMPLNKTNVLTTSDTIFKVVYTSFVATKNNLTIQSGNAFGLFIGKSYSLTPTINCPTGRNADPSLESKTSAVSFDIKSYPNPSNTDFQFDFKSASESKVGLRVYDMVGKFLEARQMNSVEVNTQRVGNNYPSGIYNVIVTQDANVKTLRVIKK